MPVLRPFRPEGALGGPDSTFAGAAMRENKQQDQQPEGTAALTVVLNGKKYGLGFHLIRLNAERRAYYEKEGITDEAEMQNLVWQRNDSLFEALIRAVRKTLQEEGGGL